MRAGDLDRDRRERRKGLAVIFKTAVDDGCHMRLATPFPDEARSRLHLRRRRRDDATLAFKGVRQLRQPPFNGNRQTAERDFLNAVGDRAHHLVAAQPRRIATEQLPVFAPKRGHAEGCELGEPRRDLLACESPDRSRTRVGQRLRCPGSSCRRRGFRGSAAAIPIAPFLARRRLRARQGVDPRRGSHRASPSARRSSGTTRKIEAPPASSLSRWGADYVLALKGNQTSLHEDAALFFADPVCAADCAASANTDAGHGRIEERECRAAAANWLAERHPDWKGLRSPRAVTARRIDKKTGGESLETRYYITSLAPDPKAILAATRAHWG